MLRFFFVLDSERAIVLPFYGNRENIFHPWKTERLIEILCAHSKDLHRAAKIKVSNSYDVMKI